MRRADHAPARATKRSISLEVVEVAPGGADEDDSRQFAAGLAADLGEKAGGA